MIPQRYKFYAAHLVFGLTFLLLMGCGSSKLAQNNTEESVRNTLRRKIIRLRQK